MLLFSDALSYELQIFRFRWLTSSAEVDLARQKRPSLREEELRERLHHHERKVSAVRLDTKLVYFNVLMLKIVRNKIASYLIRIAPSRVESILCCHSKSLV